MNAANRYERPLVKNAANHAAAPPITFMERWVKIWPDRVAAAHGAIRRTWGQTLVRCRRLASALDAPGIGEGDTVTAANIASCRERMAHFKTPRTVPLQPPPKTSTGKIQKFVPRQQVKEL